MTIVNPYVVLAFTFGPLLLVVTAAMLLIGAQLRVLYPLYSAAAVLLIIAPALLR